MRDFNYSALAEKLWDTETVNYLSLIHEYKGKQDLYILQKPGEMARMAEITRFESTEASNRIEGIETSETRLKALAQGKATPKNQSENELAGYLDVLDTIFEKQDYIPVRSNYIQQLHHEMMHYTGNSAGGTYKTRQNYVQEIHADGSSFIRFTPVSPKETEACMNSICESYRKVIGEHRIDPLLVIPVFLADFLCIHPFSDGNGRISRLLTLLLLNQAGFQIGRYISLDRHIERTKEAYYDALAAASDGWYAGTNDQETFTKYMLGIILASYREFDSKMEALRLPDEKGNATVKASVTDIVRSAVQTRIGKFTKTELMSQCPTISRSSVEAALREMIANGEIQKFGSSRSTYYVRSDALE